VLGVFSDGQPMQAHN